MPGKVEALQAAVEAVRQDVVRQTLGLGERRGVHARQVLTVPRADRPQPGAVLLADVVGEDAVVLAQPALAGGEGEIRCDLALVRVHDIGERALLADGKPGARVQGGEDGKDGGSVAPARVHAIA
jgi:hypothetical protein